MSFKVKAGAVEIGGGAPVSVQSMTNTRTSDVKGTLAQIDSLFRAGCEIVRVAVRNEQDASAISDIVKESPLPVVADIHFDYRLAITAAKNGAAKIRINPGNIGGEDKVKRLADVLGGAGIPVRIGVNGGSLESEFGGLPLYKAMAESALSHLAMLEKAGFHDTVISVKSSDVVQTVKAYRLLASETDNPLHIGITEAGTVKSGLIKSSAGIGSLLLDGIGDTVRVSLTARPEEEVFAARKLLNCLGLRKDMPEVISCPTCGRTEIDVQGLADAVEQIAVQAGKPLKIAVMGCVVNGIGEGKEADFGVAGGKEKSVLFKKGKKYRTVPNGEILEQMKLLIGEYEADD